MRSRPAVGDCSRYVRFWNSKVNPCSVNFSCWNTLLSAVPKTIKLLEQFAPLPDFVTVISLEIARPRGQSEAELSVVSWIYGPHNL